MYIQPGIYIGMGLYKTLVQWSIMYDNKAGLADVRSIFNNWLQRSSVGFIGNGYT